MHGVWCLFHVKYLQKFSGTAIYEIKGDGHYRGTDTTLQPFTCKISILCVTNFNIFTQTEHPLGLSQNTCSNVSSLHLSASYPWGDGHYQQFGTWCQLGVNVMLIDNELSERKNFDLFMKTRFRQFTCQKKF